MISNMAARAPRAALQLLLLALVVRSTVSQTEVTSDITGPTFWSRAGSPYIVTNLITIERMAPASLEIDAGVTVLFRQGSGLIVEGTLKVSGTPGLLVNMSSEVYGGSWRGLEFESNAHGVDTNWTDPESGLASYLHHVVISNAGDGLGASIYVRGDPPMTKGLVVAASRSHGIHFNDDSSKSAVFLEDTQIIRPASHGINVGTFSACTPHDRTQCKLRHITVINAASNALYMNNAGSSFSLDVVDFKAIDSGSNAINLQNTPAGLALRVFSSTIRGTNGYAIRVRRSSLTVHDTVMEDNSNGGIQLWTSASGDRKSVV